VVTCARRLLGRLACAGLLAGALLAPRPAAGESSTRSEAESLEWRLLGPTRVNRRETPRVELLLKTPPGVNASDLQLFSNAGTIELLRADGPGRWRLRYELPSEKYPGVALIAARGAAARQFASLRIELMGYPTVDIRSEPSVSVVVQAESARFGPVVTDPRGRARLEIAVPPGVREVTTLATDQRGNVREKTLPLEPPPFSRLLAVCAPQESAVYVLIVDERGAPGPSAEFHVQAESASAGRAAPLAPGLFRVELRPEPGSEQLEVHTTLGEEDSSCALPGAPALPVAEAPVEAPRPRTPLLLGVQLGASSNLAKVAGPWGALQLALPLGGLESGWRLEAQAGYTRSEARLESSSGEALNLKLDTLPLAGSIRYGLALGRWQGSAAASLGVAWVRLQAERRSGPERYSALPLWMGGAVRGAYLFSGGEAGLELGYSRAQVHEAAIRGNAAGLRASLGYLFHL
jgi:hypothetical protein